MRAWASRELTLLVASHQETKLLVKSLLFFNLGFLNFSVLNKSAFDRLTVFFLFFFFVYTCFIGVDQPHAFAQGMGSS